MRKITYLLLVFVMVFSLCACSVEEPEKTGVKPYELSDKETQLLRWFNMDDLNSKVIEYTAPDGTKSFSVNVYRLRENNKWELVADTLCGVSEESDDEIQFKGTCAISIKENGAFDLFVNNGQSQTQYKIDEIEFQKKQMGHMIGFLQEPEQASLNEDIPIAFMIYTSGTTLKTYSLDDYFKPEKFDGLDAVQYITICFYDKGI